jgi:twitching motility protein PilU
MLPFIESLLNDMVSLKAQDLYLTVGRMATIRVEEQMITRGTHPLRKEDIEAIVGNILTLQQQEEFREKFELNIALHHGDAGRFRLNAFHQQQMPGLVIRRIETNIPSICALGLPEVCKKLVMHKQGLILVSGPSGAGKSTTLAAMVGHRNEHGMGHILTIEDPIEYIHDHKQCIITQREVGIDTLSFFDALRNALRQRADVIVMGEMRDRESMEYGLQFAEAGHLCIGTIHASNLVHTLSRFINSFPQEARARILSAMANLLQAVIYQRLVMGVGGKRVLALGLMQNEGAVKTLIQEGQLDKLKELMEKSHERGMYTFDQSLVRLFKEGKITEETAIAEADSKASIRVSLGDAKQRMKEGGED